MYDPANGDMYISGDSGFPTTSSNGIYIVDSATNAIVSTILTPCAYGMAYDPKNQEVFVASCAPFGSSTQAAVLVLDGKTNTILQTILIDANMIGSGNIIFNPSDGNVYLDVHVPGGVDNNATLDQYLDAVVVINGTSNAILNYLEPLGCVGDYLCEFFDMGLGQNGLVYSYEAYGGLGYVQEFNAHKVISSYTPPLCGYANPAVAVAVDYKNNVLYISDPSCNEIIAIGSTIVTIPVDPGPGGIAFDPQNKVLYVDASGYVEGINTTTDSSIANIPVSTAQGSLTDGSGFEMAFDGANGEIYIETEINLNGCFVTSISALSNTVAAQITVPCGPYQLGASLLGAYDPTNGDIYYLVDYGSTISAIFTGPLSITLDPTSGTTEIGGSVSTTVKVYIGTPHSVNLTVPQCGAVQVSWSSNGGNECSTSVTALPSGTSDDLELTTTLTIKPGTNIITVNASIPNGPNASAVYLLSAYGFKLKFQETGLPSGTQWNATIQPSVCSAPCKAIKDSGATGSTIEFDNVAAGSYAWTVTSPISAGSGEEYAANGSSGVIFVEGDTQQAITYNLEASVTISSSPTGGGTLDPSGTSYYVVGSTFPISATASSGYAFSSWSQSQYIVVESPNSQSTKMTVNGPGTLVASFYQTVKISSNSTNVETVQGSSVLIGAVVMGGAQSVTLSSGGFPSGSTSLWSKSTITDSSNGVSDKLTITTTPSTPTGTYKIQIFADGADGQTAQDTLNLTVYSSSSANTVSIYSPKGTITFSASSGQFSNLSEIANSALPPGEPSGLAPPFGMFSWTVTGLTNGQKISVTITLPDKLPQNLQYWKVDSSSWINATTLILSASGNVLTLNMTDGKFGDLDQAANGQITDPGGIMLQQGITTTPANTLTETLGVGGSVRGMIFDSSNGIEYLENIYQSGGADFGQIFAVDPATGKIVGSVCLLYQTNCAPSTAMAYDPLNGNLYVLPLICYIGCAPSPNVYVVSTSTNKVIDTISLGTTTTTNDIVFDSANGDLYVSGCVPASPSGCAPAIVSVIDGSSNLVVDTISLTLPPTCNGCTYPMPSTLEFDPANGNIYLAWSASGYISVIDEATNTVTAQIDLGSTSNGIDAAMAVDSANGEIFVGGASNSASLFVVSTSTNTVLATIASAEVSCSYSECWDAMAFNPANADVYAIAGTANGYQMLVISAATNSVTLEIDLPADYAFFLAYNPSNSNIYVSSYNGFVYEISNTTNEIIGTIGFGVNVTSMAYDQSNNEVYFATLSGSIIVLSGSTGDVVSEIPLCSQYGCEAYVDTLLYDPANGNVYALALNGGNSKALYGVYDLLVIDGSTNKVTTAIGFGSEYISLFSGSPPTMALDSTNGQIYIPDVCTSSSTCGVGIVDTTTNTFTGTIITNGGTSLSVGGVGGLVYDPANGYLYVPDVYENAVFAINVATDTVVSRIATTSGFDPDELALDSSTGNIYVGSYYYGGISVIDGSTNAIFTTVSTKTNILSLAFDSASGEIYASGNGNFVTVVNGATNTITTTINVNITSSEFSYGTSAVLFDPTNADLYVADGPPSINAFISIISTVATSTENPLLPPIQYQVSFTETGSAAPPTVQYSLSNGTSGSGMVPFSIFIDAFPQVSLSYTFQSTVPGSTGIQYVLTGTSSASPLQVTGSLQITGTYKTQYLVTFLQDGLDATAQGAVLQIGSSGLQFASLPYSEYVDSGTTVDFAYSGSVTSSNAGERFVLTGVSGSDTSSSIDVTSPSAILGTYEIQYQVNFAISPTGSGDADSSSAGLNWYDSGGTFDLSAAPNAGYAFSSWTGPASIVLSDSSASTTTATIYGPGTIQAYFVVSTYSVTFEESGLGGASWSVTFNGNTQSSTGSSIVFSGIPLGSYAWSLTASISGGQGIRSLASTQSGTMQVSGDTVESILYIKQFLVSIAASAQADGTTSPPSGSQGWYDTGSSVPIQATPAQGFSFGSWTSSNSAILIGSVDNQNTNAIIDGPGTITANFEPSAASSIVTFTEAGLPTGTLWGVTFGGNTLTSSSDTIAFENVHQGTYSWNASNTIYVSGSGVRYVAASYSGTLNVQQGKTTQTVSYTTEYLVSFLANPQVGGTTDPSGSSWYGAGTSIAISASSASGYEFEGFATSNPSGILISASQAAATASGESTVALINGTGTITANFAKLPLGVGSAGELTDSSYCGFDTNSSIAGQQFNLIFAGGSSRTSYELTSSNPGQFYYNVFYVGTAGTAISLQIAIPYPFVTQGSVPVHEYASVSTATSGCFSPSSMLSGFTVSGTNTKTPSGATSILITDYNPQELGSVVTMTVSGVVPSSGLVYVTIHLSYGLRGTSGYDPDAKLNAVSSSITINNEGPYTFSVSGGAWDSGTTYNQNVFSSGKGSTDITRTTTPSSGVPQFPIASTGTVLLIAMLLPAVLAMGRKYDERPPPH
ncbi:MAG: hypothetical protein JRN20_07920 [Nitrososphaerota archaeon]|nr:hypothetical protein [Nitrososphaerota archaeon]